MKIPPKTCGRGNKRLDPVVLREMLDRQSISEVAAVYGVMQTENPIRSPDLLIVPTERDSSTPAQRRKIINNLSRINKRLRKGESMSAIARDLKVSSKPRSGGVTDIRRTFKRDEHGTYQSYYRGGCRCDLCKAANAERGREFRKSKSKSA